MSDTERLAALADHFGLASLSCHSDLGEENRWVVHLGYMVPTRWGYSQAAGGHETGATVEEALAKAEARADRVGST